VAIRWLYLRRRPHRARQPRWRGGHELVGRDAGDAEKRAQQLLVRHEPGAGRDDGPHGPGDGSGGITGIRGAVAVAASWDRRGRTDTMIPRHCDPMWEDAWTRTLTLPRLKPRDSDFIDHCHSERAPSGLTRSPSALTCGVSHRARLESGTVVESFTPETSSGNRQLSVGKERPVTWLSSPVRCRKYSAESDSFHPTPEGGGFPLGGSL